MACLTTLSLSLLLLLCCLVQFWMSDSTQFQSMQSHSFSHGHCDQYPSTKPVRRLLLGPRFPIRRNLPVRRKPIYGPAIWRCSTTPMSLGFPMVYHTSVRTSVIDGFQTRFTRLLTKATSTSACPLPKLYQTPPTRDKDFYCNRFHQQWTSLRRRLKAHLWPTLPL